MGLENGEQALLQEAKRETSDGRGNPRRKLCVRHSDREKKVEIAFMKEDTMRHFSAAKSSFLCPLSLGQPTDRGKDQLSSSHFLAAALTFSLLLGDRGGGGHGRGNVSIPPEKNAKEDRPNR